MKPFFQLGLRQLKTVAGLGEAGPGSSPPATILKFLYHASVFFLSVLLINDAMANNITIANQRLGVQNASAHTRIIQFDMSWENSWRDEENYDAAWVFLKYSSDGGATWHHATLQSSGTNPSGFSQGSSGTGLDIIVPSDKKGAYLHRSLTGEGSVNTDGIQFVWDYGADLGANAAGDALAALSSVRVMSIEMVYISQGPFYLGDYMFTYYYFPTSQPRDFDKAQNIGSYGYQIVVRSNDVHALKIRIYVGYYKSTGPYDDAETDTGVGLISYCYDGTGAPASCPGIWFDGALGIARTNSTYDESDFNTNWPTGLRSFYYMRYEVSQGQYRDFLNTLTPAQAVARYAGSPNISGARFGIKADNGLYGCDLNNNGVFNEADDGEWVPASVASANDSLAYNDWAAMRWVTEFEYEKAGRGPSDPIMYERANAYGGASVYPSSYTYSGTANEVPANNAEDEAWMLYNIRGLGPLRSGALATATSSRKKAMASYYGVMDLCGNIHEDTITCGTLKGRSFTAVNGDGALTERGFHDVTNWPGGPDIPVGYRMAIEYRAVSKRGGDWATTPGSQDGSRPVYLSSRHLVGSSAVGWDDRGGSVNGVWVASHGLRGGRSAE